MLPMEYLQKVYAGFLGKNIGIRLGAPVEPEFWSYERIKQVYGDIRGYVKDFRHFAADDDANGPVFFLRALNDTSGQEPTPQAVAEAWLNYAREGVGLYWWGGYGVSTEHTAYLNLKNGVPAPESGSMKQNGKTVAEQIGGQIFIDTWGLVAPCDPKRAARYAVHAAGVSHDGEALHGAAFIAACISEAFRTSHIPTVVETALALIPEDCMYGRVVRAVWDFYLKNPSDWRACMTMLKDGWGYDKYPGACHVIPNAGVCALALYYGEGDFARTIEIATMCSWDTDCNAGNVGTILGVACGLSGLPSHYRDPIGDEIVLSGISGYLNSLDIPTYAKELAAWGYRLRNETVPAECTPVPDGEINFDFTLPGSTHSLKYRGGNFALLRRAQDQNALELLLDGMVRGQGCRVAYTALWRHGDFDDERYMPVFSPTAYPGQKAEFKITFEKWHGEAVLITPYVLEALSGREYRGETLVLHDSCPETTLGFTIPDLGGGMVREAGLHVEAGSSGKFFDAGRILITGFRIYGKANYFISAGRLPREFGSILGFSHNHGAWTVEDGRLNCLSLIHAESMTGSYYMKDVRVTGSIRPLNGASHLVSVRVQGAQRGYYGGFQGADKAAILKNDHGKRKTLCEADFPWEYDQNYTVSIQAKGDQLTLSVDGKPLLTAQDNEYGYGMAGYAMYGMGRASFGDLTIMEGDD
jgi:ADP-ribosylglycohydrolase